MRAERQRQELGRELEELAERLEQAGGVGQAQSELNKRRECELVKLRRELEEAGAQHETTVVQLRRRQQEAVVEMGEQIDQSVAEAENKVGGLLVVHFVFFSFQVLIFSFEF